MRLEIQQLHSQILPVICDFVLTIWRLFEEFWVFDLAIWLTPYSLCLRLCLLRRLYKTLDFNSAALLEIIIHFLEVEPSNCPCESTDVINKIELPIFLNFWSCKGRPLRLFFIRLFRLIVGRRTGFGSALFPIVLLLDEVDHHLFVERFITHLMVWLPLSVVFAFEQRLIFLRSDFLRQT